MKLGELFYELGFKADTTKLDDFIKKVGQLDMSSIMSATGLGSLYETTKKIIDATKDASMELHRYGIITGMSAQQMSSWTKAAEQAGLQGDVVKQTFMDLQAAQAQARLFGLDQNVATGLAMIQNIGKVKITMKDYFGDIAAYQEKIKKGIEGTTEAQQRQILGMLGINEQMLIFYKSAEFAKRNQQDVFSQETVQRMRDMNAEFIKLGQQFQIIGAGISTHLSGPIIETTKALVKFIDAFEHSIFGRMIEGSIKAGILGNLGQLLFKVGELGVVSADKGSRAIVREYQEAFSRPDNKTPIVTATFHFSHVVSPEEMKAAAITAITDAVREAHNKMPSKGY